MGQFSRTEADELIVGYSFGLQTNDLTPTMVPNPGAGREHQFNAWRLKGSPEDSVTLRPVASNTEGSDSGDDD